MKIKLHHVNFCSTNVKAMNDFYRDVLDMDSVPGMNQNRTQSKDGYNGEVAFVSDGATQFHLAEKDLTAAHRTKTFLNPLERGIPYADWGAWAMQGWQQIFFYDPDGNIIEVHQASQM